MAEKYTEIFRLKEMLERENIPFEFEKDEEYIIRIPINESINRMIFESNFLRYGKCARIDSLL